MAVSDRELFRRNPGRMSAPRQRAGACGPVDLGKKFAPGAAQRVSSDNLYRCGAVDFIQRRKAFAVAARTAELPPSFITLAVGMDSTDRSVW